MHEISRQEIRVPMSVGAEVFHWTMIFATAGLWLPVYIIAKKRRKIVTSNYR